MTKHKPDCARVFKHYDNSCPRCQELTAGAPARSGWQTEHFAKKARDEQATLAAIKAHFAPGSPHSRGACGPVCTAFDW